MLIWFVVQVFGILLLVFVSVILAVYLSAVTDVLERRFRIPRWVGLTCAVVGSAALFAGAGALILPAVIDQTQGLVAGLPQTFASVQSVVAHLASRYPVLRHTDLADPTSGIVAQVIDDGLEFLRGSLLPYVRKGGAVFVEGASVLVMALYLARQPAIYDRGVVALIPPRHRALGARVLAEVGVTLRAWVAGQLLDMTALALVTAIGLWALGVPYWLAFAVLAGVVAIIPFFGTLVSTLLPALFVLSSGDWFKALTVVFLGVAIHLFEANILAPMIMQRQIAIPPVVTIAAVLIMAQLLGAVGLVVAVPVVAVVMVIVRQVLLEHVYGDAGALPLSPLDVRPDRPPPPAQAGG